MSHTATEDPEFDNGIDAPEGEEVIESLPEDQKPSEQWASSAARYEWQDEFGDVAPKVPALEEALFGNMESRGATGLDFGK